MSNKLGLHVNHWTDAARQTVRRIRPRILKVLDTAIDVYELERWHDQVPDGILVFRKWFPTDDLDAGRRVDELIRAAGPIAHLISYIETPWNECNQSGEGLDRYAAATVDAVNQLHAWGYRVAVGQFSVGQPPLSEWPRFYPALRVADALTVHEYDAPSMLSNSGQRCLRYRQVYAILPADCRKPLIVGECGIDWGVTGQALSGWRANGGLAPVAYADQLRWYGRELAQDQYVIGATIFACGVFPPESDNPGWASFDVAGVGEVEQVVMEDVVMPNVGPGFAKVANLVGSWLEDEIYHAAGTDHETSLAIGEHGYATWRKRTNETVAVTDGGEVWSDLGNLGDGKLHRLPKV